MGPYYDFNQQYMSQLPSGNPAAASSGAGNALSALGGLASGIPLIGSVISAGMNLFGQKMQNDHQMEMWRLNNEYNSPQAMMERMKAAGINPNAAAQGISGAPAAGAATMPQAAQAPDLSSVGAALGNSVNNALSAEIMRADVEQRDAQTENIKTDTKLKESQNVGQQIENQNRQDVIDKTLRQMDDKHVIDNHTSHMLANDSALSDILFTGKITQFWMNVAMMGQDLLNAQAEHENILAEINRRYSEASLNLQYASESSARERNVDKDTEIKEENRRYMAFRRNMITKYHFDPESSTEQNIAFAMSIGDYETAAAWSNGLGRLQADANGFKVDKENILNQENMGLQGIIGMAKYFMGGIAIGSGASCARGSYMSVDAKGNVTPPAGYKNGKTMKFGRASYYYSDPNATYSVFNPGKVQYGR